MFQFQNGAIIRSKGPIILLAASKFQFQNGAIISFILFLRFIYITYVSIPKWCDYKNRSISMHITHFVFQFQNGAIIRRQA